MKKYSLFFILIILIACGNINSQVIKNIEVSEFYNKINGDKKGIILDVRTSAEFHSGHIKDATNIDFYSDDFIDKLSIIRKDIPIYVYCRSGGRSSLASSKMQKLGFSKVYNLVGGIGAWEQQNRKTITSKKIQESNHKEWSVLEIENILNTNKTVLLNFSTEWCVPCKKMKLVIEGIQRENPNLKFLFINADVNKELVRRYDIKAVPQAIIFKSSKQTFSYSGLMSKEELIKNLN